MNAGMKKNELWSGVCESYTHDGMGVVKEWISPFREGTAQGRKSDHPYRKLKKTYGFGKVEELLDESAARAIPPCPLAGRCGGCQLRRIFLSGTAGVQAAEGADVVAGVARLDLECCG